MRPAVVCPPGQSRQIARALSDTDVGTPRFDSFDVNVWIQSALCEQISDDRIVHEMDETKIDLETYSARLRGSARHCRRS